ncbi:MAG: glycoside hydrolase family 38 C-terminal domain-containing protein, partial [Sedimentisphaerales bacterium]|nr:glycoside hydrolase family 38 C-terminal domain-containing protein [Sedimentisphaerales bacterium]
VGGQAGCRWVQTTMNEFIKIMKQKIDVSKLSVLEGELRDGPAGPLTGNALTTRLYLKRLNKQAQNLLIRFAEPLSVMASLAGAPFNKPLIAKAWEFLLNAHPHDSVNGVTQDKTVLDTTNRLNQVIDLAQALGNRAMQELVSRINMSEFGDEEVLITVFNPLPHPRREILEAWINMPGELEYNRFWTHESEGLQMLDAAGNPVGTQWQGQSSEKYCVAELHTRAFPFNCQRHRIFFDAGELPAGGYKIFRAGSLDKANIETIQFADSKARTGTLLVAPNVMENEFLRIEMNPNGTFDMIDKRLDRMFRNLNYYEDRGEHGDYWVNERLMFDQVHTSLGCSARIWSEESGPLVATLVSEVTMQLPRHGDKQHQKRSRELAEMTIRTAVTLRVGQEHVEVNVEFENSHEDHYLRVMFPTGLTKATHADAGGHFIVDHRPIRPQGPREGMVWPDMATLPQNNFVDVSDGTVGMAFLNDSLTEYEVLDNTERTVALSLLRAVKNWICTELRVGSGFPSQKGGQCLGSQAVRYALKPHSGNWQDANIPLAAECFNVAPIPVQTRAHKGILPQQQASLFAIDNPALRFSTIKKAEDRDSFVVRFYNPTAKVQGAKIAFLAPIEAAWLTNLNEERQVAASLPIKNGIAITVKPSQIITVEFQAKL